MSDKKRVEGYRQQSGKLDFPRPGSGGSRGTSKPRDEEAITASKALENHRHHDLITGSTIGKPTGLVDSRWKVTGQAQYGDDIRLPGELIGRIVRSTKPFPYSMRSSKLSSACSVGS